MSIAVLFLALALLFKTLADAARVFREAREREAADRADWEIWF